MRRDIDPHNATNAISDRNQNPSDPIRYNDTATTLTLNDRLARKRRPDGKHVRAYIDHNHWNSAHPSRAAALISGVQNERNGTHRPGTQGSTEITLVFIEFSTAFLRQWAVDAQQRQVFVLQSEAHNQFGFAEPALTETT